MLFRNLPPRTLAQLTEAVADVTRLNALCAGTDIDNFAYLDTQALRGGAGGEGVFSRRVDRLLT